MILEAAIGDAYGAGFEFQSLDYIHKNNHLMKYYPHGHYQEIYKRYTDDTQMAIAIAELLLEEENWNEVVVANKFVEVFHRDKRRGYSNRMYNALDSSKNGQAFINQLNNESGGNGSAMRAYPIGLIKDIPQLLEYAEIQAKVSHDTIQGISCAKRMALAVHFYKYEIYNQMPLIEFLNETLKEKEVYEIISPIDMKGFPTTKAVVKIVSTETNMTNCLKTSIDYGGDTDTVASLCLALLSQKKECQKELPSFLHEELENGKFGRDFLIELDDKLTTKFI